MPEVIEMSDTADSSGYEEVDPETEERPQIGADFWISAIIAYGTIAVPFMAALLYLIFRR